MLQILIYIFGFFFIFIWISIKILFIGLFDFREIKDAFIKEIARIVVLYNIDTFRLQQYIADIKKDDTKSK